MKHYMNITTFSDEQLAGQRLMVGFDGIELNRELKYLIDRVKVGGVILFARNLINPEQIKQLCLSLQGYAAACGQPPLFIAIDQEGGQVARLKQPFTQFAGNPEMEGQKDARHFAEVTATELSRTGINMNLAPVLDVAFNAQKSIMAGRAFGADPIQSADLGSTVIEHLQQSGIMAVAKHFPGIGRTTLDSHVEMPILDIDLETLTATDLLPFEAAIKREVSGIMLAHILYSQLDSEWPASLSATIARDVLRDQMGFNGVVLTDDLDMGAIKKRYDIKTVVSRILLAEIDVALICHQGPDIENAFKEILNAHESSQLIKAQGQESVKRILRLKERFLS